MAEEVKIVKDLVKCFSQFKRGLKNVNLLYKS